MFKISSAAAAGTVLFYAGSFVYATGLIACFFYCRIRNHKGETVHQGGGTGYGGEVEGVADYNVKLLDVTHGASSGAALTPEGQAFADFKPKISQFPEGKRPPEYTELGNFPHPFMSRISAREMAKLIAFLKGNGGYSLITTQELGNCLWASVQRGTDVKKEFASMHLRRLVVMMIGAYPKFFFNYLKYSLATTYGQDRPTEEEITRKKKEGTITSEQAHDYRLPGPFTFAEYVQHLLTDGTWGDDHVLTLVSLLWQVKITILNAATLGEIRIRHNDRLSDAELVVVFIGGDHYMGTG